MVCCQRNTFPCNLAKMLLFWTQCAGNITQIKICQNFPMVCPVRMVLVKPLKHQKVVTYKWAPSQWPNKQYLYRTFYKKIFQKIWFLSMFLAYPCLPKIIILEGIQKNVFIFQTSNFASFLIPLCLLLSSLVSTSSTVRQYAIQYTAKRSFVGG